MTKTIKIVIIISLSLLTRLVDAQTVGNVIRDVPGHSVAKFICANDEVLKFDTTLEPPMFKCAADNAGTSGYTTIQEEGTGLTARSTLNFIGATITCADDAGNSRTNCTVTTATNALLDGTNHTDTTNSAVTQGDIIFGNGTPAWDDLSIGTVGQVLTVNAAGTLPEWQNPDLGNPEGPPWAAVRHWAYLKFSQTSRTTAPTWGGAVADFTWTRDSAATGLAGTPTKAYVFTTNSTTTNTNSGYRFGVGSTTGYAMFNNRPVMHYHFYVTDNAGTDSTKYIMYASMNNSSNNLGSDYAYALAIAMGCTTGNNTITSLGTNLPGFLLACWNKNAQANVQACSSTEVIGAGNGTLVCVDTGIAAPASGTEIDIALDFLDSANAKVWVNNVATTLTTNLPSPSARMVQKAIGMRTTAATTALEMVLENMEEWWD